MSHCYSFELFVSLPLMDHTIYPSIISILFCRGFDQYALAAEERIVYMWS